MTDQVATIQSVPIPVLDIEQGVCVICEVFDCKGAGGVA